MAPPCKFEERPLAPVEELSKELERLRELQKEDPIAVQDAFNTSRALANAAKEGDLEEMRSIVANIREGELLQAFTIEAFLHALQRCSLEMVKAMVEWGVPLGHAKLVHSLHSVCEAVTPENFGNTWRILRLLVNGNDFGKIDVDTPRSPDGWTPLCIACAHACLPLASKLLDLGADPNTITSANKTPVALARQRSPTDGEEQKEARDIIVAMLLHHGGQESWKDALKISRKTRRKPAQADSDESDGTEGAAAAPALPAPCEGATKASKARTAEGEEFVKTQPHKAPP